MAALSFFLKAGDKKVLVKIAVNFVSISVGGYDDGYGHSGYGHGGHGGGYGGCTISAEQWLGAVLIAGTGVAIAAAAFGALFLTLTGGKRKRSFSWSHSWGELFFYWKRM